MILTNQSSYKLDFNLKILMVITIVMFYQISFGATSEEMAYRETLVTSLYKVVNVITMLVGLSLMVLGGVKLKKKAENPNDPKAFTSVVLITFISGALLFNYSGTSDTLIATMLGDDKGHCFILADKTETSDIHSNNCWDSKNSDYVNDELKKRIEGVEGANEDAIKKNINIIMGIFQLFGTVFLGKGIYGLYQAAEGQQGKSYGKSIVTMIAAALVIDLPHTLEMLNETVKLLGFGV
ncbi:hypothetical protein [Vibrio harveyi]|uniref:hypothetical protein n=1 Tax=Vibrio harveyi TaxID=669 RepID=UPI0023805AF9|nr:hypothetical protein [Vibrio harveyi]